jgi:hypothetical protein
MHRLLFLALLLAPLIQGCVCRPPQPKTASLADGRSFAGWEGDTAGTWRIVDGAFVGGSLTAKVPRNEFLATERNFTNFVLRLEFKLEGDSAKGMVNSGVQFHSQRIPGDSEMAGYQADLGDPSWWGSLYDESRRNKTLAPSDMAKLGPALRRNDWNVYEIRAENGRIRTWINGVLGVDFTEADPAIPQWGRIALQIHGGGPAQVSFRNITLVELPLRRDR